MVTYGWKQGADGVALWKLEPMTHGFKIKWKPEPMKIRSKERKKPMEMSRFIWPLMSTGLWEFIFIVKPSQL